MRVDFEAIEEKTKQFRNCRDINEFDQTFDFEKFKQEKKELEPIREMFDKLGKWENNINKYIKLEEKRGLIVASGRKIKEKLQNRVKKEQDNLRTHLFDLAGKTEKDINGALSQIKSNLNKPISDLKSYVEFVNKLEESKKEIVNLAERKTKLEQMKTVLSKYRVKDDTAINNTSKITNLQGKIDQIADSINNVTDLIKEAGTTAEGQKEENIALLAQVIQQEQEKIIDYIEKCASDTLMNKITPPKDALDELKKLKNKFESCTEKLDLYRTYEKILGVPAADIPEIEKFNVKFNRREKIWSNLDTFREQKTKWYNDNFKKMDAEAIVKTVGKFAKENIDMKNRLKKDEKDEVLEDLTREVKEVEAQKHLILALGQRAMQPRHWTKVYAALDH